MTGISVLMPVYKGMPYIREAVESVLAQNYYDWELLISDDGSIDGTRDWLRTLSDSRIRLFEQPINLGIFGNLNFLFKHANSPISHILCEDDYFLDDGLRQIVEEWAVQPTEVGFIRHNFDNEILDSHFGNNASGLIPALIRPSESSLYFYTFGCICGNLSNVSVRTHLIEQSGWFRTDLPYAGDFEFWSRLARSHTLCMSNKKVTFIRKHSMQASVYLNTKGELVDQLMRIVSDLYALLKNEYSPLLLRLHGALQYDGLQRDRGIKALLLTGDLTYLKKLEAYARRSDIHFGVFFRWLIYLISGGGRIGRDLTAGLLLRQLGRYRSPKIT